MRAPSEDAVIVLPRELFETVRAAVVDEAIAYADEVHAEAKRTWSRLSRMAKNDLGTYRNAIRRRRAELAAEAKRHETWPPPLQPTREQDRDWALFADDVDAALAPAFDAASPRQPRKDPSAVPRPRASRIDIDELTIIFDRKTSTVRWHVIEDSYEVDRAHRRRAWVALDRKLRTLRWTPQTGGTATVLGTDVAGYGPAGKLALPHSYIPYLDERGDLHGPNSDAIAARRLTGAQERVSRGQPAGGQFTSRRRSEAELTLF